MMRNFSCLIGLISLVFLGSAQAQDSTSLEEPKFNMPDNWQANFVLGDVLRPAFTLEYSKAIAPQNHLGVRASVLGSYANQGTEAIYESLNSAFAVELFQKYFFESGRADDFIFFRHGLRVGRASLSLPYADWLPYTDPTDGNTYYSFSTIEVEDLIIPLSYQIAFGIQSHSEVLHIEWYLGLAYRQILNYSSLKGPEVFEDRNSDDLFDQNSQPFFVGPNWWLYRGLMPTVGLAIGFGGR
jgi:hypothetical protein